MSRCRSIWPRPCGCPTARPLAIAFAQTAVNAAAADLQRADVLWLPNFSVGVDYMRHDGADQQTDGDVIFDSKNAMMIGGGFTMRFSVDDALFLPLIARQQLAARQNELQSARNDSLLAVATAYFDVQQSRGRLASAVEATARAEELVRRVAGLAKDLAAPVEVDRARTLLLTLQQELIAARAAWRVSSSRLARVLRLNPAAVVIPLEPPFLQVTLISPRQAVDDLIPVGLLNRPELATQRALVELTLERLRQEHLRPLLPSVVLQGKNGPDNSLMGGLFGGGTNDQLNTWGGRTDIDVGVVWTLNNLGAGNRARSAMRAAEHDQATVVFCDTQDRIAQEVVETHANLEAAADYMAQAENRVKEAVITFRGTLIGIGEVRGAGDLLQAIDRPQEAVAALQELYSAYLNYFTTVNGYNRAQFQLYHALGYPARILACDCPAGEIQAVDTTRPSMR